MTRAWFLALLLVMGACATTAPVAIRAGEVCFHCRRTITNPSLAAEVISESQHAFKFASVGCLTEYLREHPEEGVRAIFVTDFAKGKLLPADDAFFVKAEVDPRVKQVDYVAFRYEDAAQLFAREKGATVVDWGRVVQDRAIGHAGH